MSRTCIHGEVVGNSVVFCTLSKHWDKLKIFGGEIREVLRLAWPLSVGYFLEMAMNIMCLFILGHIGASELAASSLAFGITSILGFSLGFGLLVGVDTLAAQAWGAGNFKSVGRIAMRASIIISIFCVPITVIWVFVEYILLALGQDPVLSKMAGQFTRWMILGLWPALQFEVIRRWLQAQSIVLPATVILAVSLPLLLVTVLCLVLFTPLGFLGCPVGLSLVYWMQFLGIVGYTFFMGNRIKCWPKGFSGCMCDWGTYFKIAIPGALMLCVEGWGFEIMTFIAGLLGTLELAVYTLLLNTYYILYMVPSGIGLASCTRISQLLGNNNPSQAKLSCWLTILLNTVIEIICGILLLLCRNPLAHLFTTDEEMIYLFDLYSPILSAVMVVDGVQIVSGAAIRGTNHSTIGVILNIIAFYLCGIPLGVALAFAAGLSSAGLWCGIALSDAVSAALLITVLAKTSWTQVAGINTVSTNQTDPENVALLANNNSGK